MSSSSRSSEEESFSSDSEVVGVEDSRSTSSSPAESSSEEIVEEIVYIVEGSEGEGELLEGSDIFEEIEYVDEEEEGELGYLNELTDSDDDDDDEDGIGARTHFRISPRGGGEKTGSRSPPPSGISVLQFVPSGRISPGPNPSLSPRGTPPPSPRRSALSLIASSSRAASSIESGEEEELVYGGLRFDKPPYGRPYESYSNFLNCDRGTVPLSHFRPRDWRNSGGGLNISHLYSVDENGNRVISQARNPFCCELACFLGLILALAALALCGLGSWLVYSYVDTSTSLGEHRRLWGLFVLCCFGSCVILGTLFAFGSCLPYVFGRQFLMVMNRKARTLRSVVWRSLCGISITRSEEVIPFDDILGLAIVSTKTPSSCCACCQKFPFDFCPARLYAVRKKKGNEAENEKSSAHLLFAYAERNWLLAQIRMRIHAAYTQAETVSDKDWEE